MRIVFVFLVLVVFGQFNVRAQSNEYSFMSNADLQNLKAEVVKKAEYSTAAKIQSEIDLRATEAKNLAEYKKKLDAAVNAQDFAKAAQIQEEMKVLNEKNELRLKIEESLKKGDYAGAADAKDKLKLILDGNSTQPMGKSLGSDTEVKNKNEKTVEQPQENSGQADLLTPPSTTDTHLSRGFSSLSCGMNAPLGFMFGDLKMSGVGFYMNFRTNFNAFETSDYEMEGGVINDDFWIFDYNGISKYSRLEANIGLTTRITGDLDGFGLFAYTGVGAANYRYLYEYERIGPTTGTSYGPSIIVDKSLSGWNVNIEAGLLFNINRFNFHTGVVAGIPNFSQSMFVVGIGYSSK